MEARIDHCVDVRDTRPAFGITYRRYSDTSSSHVRIQADNFDHAMQALTERIGDTQYVVLSARQEVSQTPQVAPAPATQGDDMSAQPQADARGKVYRRTENGTDTLISVKEALAEVNTAMMGGRREVKAMWSSRGQHVIEYKGGPKVKLIEIDAPQAAADDSSEAPERWSTTHSGWTAHKFNQDDRALCNKSIRPRSDTLIRDDYRTRAYFAASPNTWRICPRCDSK